MAAKLPVSFDQAIALKIPLRLAQQLDCLKNSTTRKTEIQSITKISSSA